VKKVLFYESRPEWGGAQKCEMDLILGLEAEDLKTYFLTSSTGPMVDRVMVQGKEITMLPVSKRVNGLRKEHVKSSLLFYARQFFQMVPHLWKVFLYLMKNKIDVVYTSQMRSQLTIGWLARLTGKKVIWHIHGQENLTHFLGKLCLKSSTKVIVVSNEIVSAYRKLFPDYRDHFVAIHNGLDLPSVNGESADPSREVTLVMVGSLIKSKRQDLIIQAIAKLKEAGYLVRLNIVGEKPDWHTNLYMDSLYQQVDSLGISDQVTFWGWVEEPVSVLQQSDLFVLPSDTEGLPLSIIEAMAAGLPCIATRVGGIPELIEDHHTGLLISPGNVDDLVEAIKNLLDHPQLLDQMGINARKRYEDYFTRKRFLEGVASVIHTI
jgi:L-malate glycosyltransferase